MQSIPKQVLLITFSGILLIIAAGLTFTLIPKNNKAISIAAASPLPTPSLVEPSLEPSPSPTPVPTLSPEEREAKYGPCVYLPTLMYHHVTDEATAKAGSYASLNVTPEFFEKQMSYLETKGYQSVSMQDLINFFDNDTQLSNKPVLVTFDDGYEDFYTHAAPILQAHNIKATNFIPTGLVTVPNYLTWEELNSMRSNSNLLFANHTWSHQSANADSTKLSYEIKTADTQLKDHGLGQVAVFAYPYGPSSANAEQILGDLSYKLAFTTIHGFYQCKKQRFDLPRIRVGNAQLNSYGL